ncbi:MAG TPA: Trp family transcriptional regulator [Xanthomonadales bacterium]|nr:Trp family transcriptional regulator [Xanthomonadales bacterium]
MTKISRLKVDPQQLGFFMNNFWSLITLLEDKDQVKSFLKDLLTHTEMKMFAKRIQIAKMLLEGYSYQDIRGYVKVTDSTISKISNLLSVDGAGLKTAIKYLHRIEEQIENNRMKTTPSLKEKYPEHFLPDRIANKVGEMMKKGRRKKSAVKDIKL